ncbi:MAG: hypothetical protein J4F36_07160 [Nitrosopumilaceae archaeon]|nr:hypothetical protein [Nitrosopumilaceae archaeon]
MTHVDENNYAIADFDILSSELIKSMYSKDVGVIIISPWVKDYALPVTWPSFTSNFINIIDMQRTSDILKLLLQNRVNVTIVTSSSTQLKNDHWNQKNIQDSLIFCDQIKNAGGKIIYNKKNHGKVTLTSECCLTGSGNFTNKGRDPKLQDNAGVLENRSKDERSYVAKVTWVNKIIDEGQPE